MTETQALTSTRPLAPDDLLVGGYVTIARTTYELVPDDASAGYDGELRPLRIAMIPSDAGRPLKVHRLCLPFVLVKDPAGAHHTLDLRRHHLVRLDPAFGAEAFERLGTKSGGKSKRKKNKGKHKP